MLSLSLFPFAAPAQGKIIEFIYSGTIDYAFYESDPPFQPIAPGTPWTARLLFNDTAPDQCSSAPCDQSLAVYPGIGVDLAIGSSLTHFTPVTISLANDHDLNLRGAAYLDSIDVFAGPDLEVYLTVNDQGLDAIHSTALPASIDLAVWENHGIALSIGGYATGPIDRITCRIVPEPGAFVLLNFGYAALILAAGRSHQQKAHPSVHPPKTRRQCQ
jgi:hypothetical protein